MKIMKVTRACIHCLPVISIVLQDAAARLVHGEIAKRIKLRLL